MPPSESPEMVAIGNNLSELRDFLADASHRASVAYDAATMQNDCWTDDYVAHVGEIRKLNRAVYFLLKRVDAVRIYFPPKGR